MRDISLTSMGHYSVKTHFKKNRFLQIDPCIIHTLRYPHVSVAESFPPTPLDDDLCKAFDTISHSNLLEKLPLFGVHGDKLDSFVDYLFGRSVVVNYNKSISNVRYVLRGVPQGSILSPLIIHDILQRYHWCSQQYKNHKIF